MDGVGEAAQPKPFSVRTNVTVVEGGWLSEPWVVNTTEVDGREFVIMSKEDRKLARAFGMPMDKRYPRGENDMLAYLAELRDAKIDDILRARDVENDPMGERPDVDVPADVLSIGRQSKFHAADVPAIVQITYPAFTTSDGDRVPAYELNVISTPKRLVKAKVELTPENLAFLSKAAVEFQHARKRHEGSVKIEDLPALTSPLVRWRRRGGRWLLACRFYDRCARKWKAHVATPNLHPDPDIRRQLVQEAEASVLAFYEQHHSDPLTMDCDGDL